MSSRPRPVHISCVVAVAVGSGWWAWSARAVPATSSRWIIASPRPLIDTATGSSTWSDQGASSRTAMCAAAAAPTAPAVTFQKGSGRWPPLVSPTWA